MTRFARAKGSKSSNERVPEQATSWSEMRRDLHRESVRKAAEEQIERESHSELHHTLEKSVLGKSATKTKINEPTELAPFDSKPRVLAKSVLGKSATKTKINEPTELAPFDKEPSVSTHAIQIAEYPKKSVTEKMQKINNHDVSMPGEVQCSSLKTFVIQKSEQNLYRTQLNQPRLVSPTRESLPSEIPELGFSEGLSASKDSSLKMKIKTGTSIPNLPSTSKRKFQNQPKTSKEGDDGDTEPQIGGNFKGYPVPVEDAETLTDAYNILRKEGQTHKQAMDRIKPERRRAEKRLARLKSTICFRCRKPGHRLSDCPMGDIDCAVCFKCGSTTHKYQECRKKGSFVNAKCFICGHVGHLSAQCPENSHGVYPEGGECKICGEKSHLVKDCPENKNNKDHHPGTTEFDDYFDEKPSKAVEPKKKKIKKVLF